MRTRYDVIVSFGLDITDHFYAGDTLVGGLTYDNLQNLCNEGHLERTDFFPELISQLNSIFGGKEYMTTCTINEQDLSIYFRCEAEQLERFEKKILGWVLINELEQCFKHYCVIDYDNKVFKIKDVQGVETTDKLRGFTLVLEDGEDN
jgi:hypothetical protein